MAEHTSSLFHVRLGRTVLSCGGLCCHWSDDRYEIQVTKSSSWLETSICWFFHQLSCNALSTPERSSGELSYELGENWCINSFVLHINLNALFLWGNTLLFPQQNASCADKIKLFRICFLEQHSLDPSPIKIRHSASCRQWDLQLMWRVGIKYFLSDTETRHNVVCWETNHCCTRWRFHWWLFPCSTWSSLS